MSTILRLKIGKSRPVRRGHDYYWKVIRDLTEIHSRDVFTISEILDKCTRMKRPDVNCFLRLLVKAGIAEKVEHQDPDARLYFRLKTRPIATPVLSRSGKTTSGQGQTNMWNTMCHLLKSGFSVRELCIHAATADVPITHSTAKSYVVALNRAGMLIVRGKGVATSYRLKPSANTGPKAPKILRSKMVYDANTETIVGDVEAEEVAS